MTNYSRDAEQDPEPLEHFARSLSRSRAGDVKNATAPAPKTCKIK